MEGARKQPVITIEPDAIFNWIKMRAARDLSDMTK